MLGWAAAGQAAVPSAIVDVHFDEPSGLAAANAGTFGGQADLVQDVQYPEFSSNVPNGPMTPDNNAGAVDFGGIGTDEGGRAIDLVGGPDGTLGAFSAFTLTGWVNPRDLTIGWGGNRIVFGLAEPGGAGFDLVHLANGAMRIGINQWPDGANGGGPQSSPGMLKADPQTGADNWVFFAVTYDAARESGNLEYYFGGPAQLAQLDSAHDYKGGNPDNGGVIEYSGSLTIGNFSAIEGARTGTGPANSRCFRGLIDEIKIYDQALTLSDIQRAQLNGKTPTQPVSITQQPVSRTSFVGQRITLQVQANGAAPISYQWQRNGANIPNATESSYTIPAAALSDNGAEFVVKITNAGGTVQSETATVTVVEESGHKVFLSFSDGGATTTNRGNLNGNGVYARTDGFPIATAKTPAGPFAPSDNIAAVDFGSILDGQGGRAIDFTNAFDGTLGSMTGFTVSGWVNSTDLRVGWGGNRIVFGLAEMGGPGLDVVQLPSGALQLGVNQWPDGSPALSSAGMITESPEADAANWVFFAVTYDGTQPFANANFYFGKPDQEAQLDVTADYDRGPILQTGPLTIGNFSNIDLGARNRTGPENDASRCFRGLMDEINVFNRVLTLEEIQALQKAPAYRPAEIIPVVIVEQPRAAAAFEGQGATFNVVFTGSPPVTIQWQRDGQDIPGANESAYSLLSVSMADHGAQFRAKISNSAGSVTSEAATLNVTSVTGTLVSLSFSEGSGASTSNQGDLGGSGAFVQADGFPVFSTQVPAGAFAPANNTSSVDFGIIEEGQGGRAIDFTNPFGDTLGSMSAFTVCGWLNSRDLRAGWGGNRVAFALSTGDGPGFDLVQQADGSLRIGVNQWPDGSGGGGPASTPGMITEDPNAAAGNWVFFAVTYDSAQPFGHVIYYFGRPGEAAIPDLAGDYFDRGPIDSSGRLTIGNFGSVVGARTETGPEGGSRVFRGLIDEVKVFNTALTLEEIQEEQKAPAQIVVVSPRLSVAGQTQAITVSWEVAANFQLQSADTLGSDWTDVTTAPVVTGNQASVTVPITGATRFFRLKTP